MAHLACVALALLVSSAAAASHGNSTGVSVTKCQAGVTNLVGDNKAFTVQVCNYFGATCYMNQVSIASGDCATKALQVNHGTCALFPTNYPAQTAVGTSGCSVSCSNSVCTFSGGCVSVQCSLTGGTFAGPAMTTAGGSGSGRTTGVTDTSAANAFTENTFAELEVSGSKTVFLSRTGNYVGTYSRGGSATGTNSYNFGKLPTIAGNNYGPKACPSASTLVSAATETKEELRMCGSTGKWVYFGAINLLKDTSLFTQYSGDSASGVGTSKINIGSLAFLNGNSKYKSGNAMDDARQVYILDGNTASASVLHTSATITPAASSGMATTPIAGTWRFYQVVFYCDDYARTDLTACAAANQKIAYVADPNPAPQYGSDPSFAGGGSGTTNSEMDAAARAGLPMLAVIALVAALGTP